MTALRSGIRRTTLALPVVLFALLALAAPVAGDEIALMLIPVFAPGLKHGAFEAKPSHRLNETFAPLGEKGL